MTDIVVPFRKVATHDQLRQPRIVMNSEILDWLTTCKSEARFQYLLGRDPSTESWKVMFEFQDNSEAVMFKLTFGGA